MTRRILDLVRAAISLALTIGCGRIGFGPSSTPIGEPCVSDAACGACGACDAGYCAALAFTTLSVGYHSTCGIDLLGSPWCWGDDYYGELGLGHDDSFSVPTRVKRIASAQHIAVGWLSGVALDDAGELHFWGESGNASDDATGGWSVLAAGMVVACGIKVDGTLWCWGANDAGQCGQGFVSPLYAYAALGQVGTDADWAIVAPGDFGTCAIKVDSRLFCWGNNSQGELGQGAGGPASAVPLQVPGSWLDVATGELTACAIATDHTLWCWGTGLADGVGRQTVATPTQLGSDVDWQRVRHKSRDACAQKLDGSWWCWGGDENGTLDHLFATTPQQLDVTATALLVGGSHLCALFDGTWQCLGDNESGELGTGDTTPRSTFAPICP